MMNLFISLVWIVFSIIIFNCGKKYGQTRERLKWEVKNGENLQNACRSIVSADIDELRKEYKSK